MPTNRRSEGTTPARPEELVGASTGTTVINGLTFAGKQVTYTKVGDLAIFEGDVVLGRHADLEGTASRDADVAYGVAITGSRYRWPDALVPYEIDPAMPDQYRVTDAMAHWTAHTAVHFVARTAANAGQYPNYVHFFAGDGCYSTVGMVGGRQDVSLGSGCGTGNAIHEIGHTIGLWHEQSREDRDSFVTINWANIDPAYTHNFDQHVTDGDDIGGYDYGSIMHYPGNAFSKNGQPTIVPLQPGVTIGQRNALSAGDIAAANTLYPRVVVPPFKKTLDDAGPGFKKVRDDVVVPTKKTLDDGNVKKVLDDQRPPFKKVRDDIPISKIVRDLPYPVLQPQIPRPGPVEVGLTGELPLILATAHHADAAAAYDAVYGAGAGATADPTSALLAAAVENLSAAAQALQAASEALAALLGGQG